MNYIRFAINNPVKVAVGVLLLLLFGILALLAIPIQLTPNVDQPIITVETTWIGRSPQEIEREIVEEQEDKLKGLTNLKKMTATAQQNAGSITLEFYIGTDMTRALQEVSDSLREVPDYPEDVDEPVISASDSSSGAENAIAWLIITSSDPDYNVQRLGDVAEDRIKPLLERVEGISEVQVYGGRERQVHILIDPAELAQRGITFNQLASALQMRNVNVSAGEVQSGRLDVRVRTVGQYDQLDQIRDTIVTYTEGGPVRIADLGEVELTLEKERSFVRSSGREALALPVTRETGSNVMAVMDQLQERIDQINAEVLPDVDPSLTLEQVYDETTYIEDAISLVTSNLFIGGSFAVLVLLLYLRTIRPTVVVAVSIPVSIIGTFVVMTALGRNLNVISLAGLAFAVGMVVDAAIVVLENIDRHLAMGKRPAKAALDGASEVWGAILASALTTLCVFIPVIFMQEEAGQLFRDISIAICAAVALSLIVSVTVIPTASSRFLKTHTKKEEGSVMHAAHTLLGLTWVLDKGRTAFANVIYWLTGRNAGRVLARMAIVTVFTAAAVLGAWQLMPPTSYLPSGNQNMVFGLVFNPPGYNIDQNLAIARHLETLLDPYIAADGYEELEQMNLPPVKNPQTGQALRVPPIADTFIVSFRGMMFMGAMSGDKENVAPLQPLVTGSMMSVPGSMGFAQQASIFGRGLGGTDAIDIEISGEDLGEIREFGTQLMLTMMGRYGQQGVRPDPINFYLASPEMQIHLDAVRAQELGIQTAELGLGVQALVDGATVGDYRHRGENIDLMLKRNPGIPVTPESLAAVPMAAVDYRGESEGMIVPLSAVAEIEHTDAPQQINRIQRRRAVKLTVVPEGVPLETAMVEIQGIVEGMRQQGTIPPGVDVELAGTADKLTEVRESMLGAWHGMGSWGELGQSLASLISSRMFLALLVTFLLMAALFESFLYPLVIMFSVPLATVGGFAGLAIMHAFYPDQQLDVLTMLGFVILIGIVVNNAILIVHQALNFMQGLGEGEGDRTAALSPRQAIRESVRTRIRPIFMTTTTSVCGMLPLVLMPGSGSELYRGLGSVVVGGLIVSALFTLIVVPLLFSLVLDAKRGVYRMLSWQLPETSEGAEVATA